jgi:hypothetical protein
MDRSVAKARPSFEHLQPRTSRMLPITKPTFDLSAHFQRCASATRNVQLRGRLLASEARVVEDSVKYDEAGQNGTIFSMVNSPPASASDAELTDLYSRSMVRRNSPGRSTYDALTHAAPYGICPLCGQRPVSSLDHYLPKEHFPKLAVSPVNLVPSCMDCNHLKRSFVPASASEQLLHPYFDHDISDHWLKADVTHDTGQAVVNFHADPPIAWGQPRSARLLNHFSRMELASLYSIYGTSELELARVSINRILESGTSIDVARHFHDCWLDRFQVNKNSWQAATYAAFSVDVRICSGEF